MIRLYFGCIPMRKGLLDRISIFNKLKKTPVWHRYCLNAALCFSLWEKHGGHCSGFSCRIPIVTFWLAEAAGSLVTRNTLSFRTLRKAKDNYVITTHHSFLEKLSFTIIPKTLEYSSCWVSLILCVCIWTDDRSGVKMWVMRVLQSPCICTLVAWILVKQTLWITRCKCSSLLNLILTVFDVLGHRPVGRSKTLPCCRRGNSSYSNIQKWYAGSSSERQGATLQ